MSTIRPQPGPQTIFLKTAAEIALYGGAAGSGKSYALLLEPLRHINNSRFNAIIFRRNSTQVRNPGGLWQESLELYSQFEGHSREAFLEWDFPSGMRCKFAHLENLDTVYNYQGSQMPLIMWDELVHFEEFQFWYLLSRLRSMSGVPGYMRATCNPDYNSWVRKLVDWWIGPDGFPIPERSGVLRWFIRVEDKLIWASTKRELIEKYGANQIPKSFTFIPAKIHDNRILMEKDPAYLSNLMALSRVERMRLLEGNWNVRASAGTIFRRDWFEIINAIPAGWSKVYRYWDKAATRPSEENKDPDWTRGVLLYGYPNGTYVVADVRGIRDSPLAVERMIKNTASFDGPMIVVFVEQEPGSAGVADAGNYVRLLSGYNIQVRKPTKDKVTRALPVSAQCEAGNVKILRAPWNDDFLNELENFGEDCTGHDDQCLVAGTMIATTSGDKPIEQIKAGEMVLTPIGPKKVLISAQTGVEKTMSKCGITGTHNHPVFQEGAGFINLDAIHGAFINYLSCYSLIRWTLRKQLFLTKKSSVEWTGKKDIISVSQTLMPGENAPKVCMLRCGSLFREKGLKAVITFIIRMVTHLITTLTTWSVYRLKNTTNVAANYGGPAGAPVYNLKVEGASCYYANGILVGNCDAFSGAFNEMAQGKSMFDVL